MVVCITVTQNQVVDRERSTYQLSIRVVGRRDFNDVSGDDTKTVQASQNGT
jgi:hypothetical protein